MSVEDQLRDIKRELREIRKILTAKVEAPKWVRAGVLISRFHLSREQIRYMRRQDPTIARKIASGQYEYNITEIASKVAAVVKDALPLL